MKGQNEYLDIEVIKRFQAGDDLAFNEIYSRYYKHIYYLGLHYFRDEEKAQDLIQDTFINVYKYGKNLENPEAFFVWLERIAYNCCISSYRKSKKDASFYANDDKDGFIEDAFRDMKDINQVDKIQMDEAKKVILKTLDELPAEQRAVGYLRFFEELSFKEISEITQTPIGTVMSRFNRIKEKLKKNLKRRHFTKETCFSALLITNMKNVYKGSVLSTEIPSHIANTTGLSSLTQGSHILSTTSKSGHKGSLFSGTLTSSTNLMMFMVIAVPVSVILGTFIPYSMKNNQSLAEIKNIQYKTELTNQPIKLLVELTSDNYDEFKINGKRQSTINENGTHEITLIKDKKIIDSEQITITNIDKDAPVLKSSNTIGDSVELYFEDTGSGIDYKKIKCYENNKEITDFQLDIENGEIIVNKELGKDRILKISDYAGNVLKININFFEING